MKIKLALFLLCLCVSGCGLGGDGGVSPSPAPTPTPTPVETPEPTRTPGATPDILAEPEEPEELPPPVSVTIQLAGDILLHSGPIKNAEIGAREYDFKPYFEHIAPYLDGDLSICNMEAPVDAFGGNQDLSTYPRFNSPYEILEALKWAGFDHLLTANNHAFDKGAAGLEATIANMARAGISFTGTYLTPEAYETPTVVDAGGVRVGIVNYTDSCNGLESLIPEARRAYAMRTFRSGSLDDLPKMAADIAAARRAGADIVVMALHWGAEYADKPAQAQRDIALALCEAGADIIMGGHSHCVQPVEWADVVRDGGQAARCLIFYSLGNFFADQIALDPPRPKTQYGMLANVTVTKSPDGVCSLDGCSVLPTLSYRSQKSGGARYRLMPLTGLGELVYPDFLTEPAAAQAADRAYAHVAGIVDGAFLRP